MSDVGLIATAWIVVAVVLALYSARLLWRGRALSRAVDPDRRRWMDAKDES